ncbi:MAG: Mu transposase domain-containing protein [Candidatus Binatia bacterium]
MFAEEKPLLQPLPIEPFRYYQYGERVVHLDGCVEVERAYYGLPPGWIGRQVKVQWDALHVRILDPHSHQLLREHLRQFPGNYRINGRPLQQNSTHHRATVGPSCQGRHPHRPALPGDLSQRS